MSTQFIVEIDLRTRGDLSIAPMDRGLRGLGDNVVRVRRDAVGLSDAIVGGFGKASHVIDGMVANVARLGLHGAMVGFAGGVAAATYGVVGLNKELETTRISLGSIYSAQGITRNLDDGIDLAEANVARMRKLAAKLPGEFEDLQNIMATTAIPAFHAGVGHQQHLQLSSKLMAGGVVAKMPLDQVAREAAQLIEGRAGAHNVLGMRLMGLHGASAEKFNSMAAPERLAMLETELDKYAPAIDKFSTSFEGLSTTFLDAGKDWLRLSTEPLFKRGKDYLREANTWLSENDATVERWATYVGDNLVAGLDHGIDLAKEIGPVLAEGFQGGIELIREYGPAFEEFARNAAGEASEIWKAWKGPLGTAGNAAGDMLKDPRTAEFAMDALMLWGGSKAYKMFRPGGLTKDLLSVGTRGGRDAMALMSGTAAVRTGGAAAAFTAGEAGLVGPLVMGVQSAGSQLVAFGSAVARVAGPLGLLSGAITLGTTAVNEREQLEVRRRSQIDDLISNAMVSTGGSERDELNRLMEFAAEYQAVMRAGARNQSLLDREVRNLADQYGYQVDTMAKFDAATLSAAVALQSFSLNVSGIRSDLDVFTERVNEQVTRTRDNVYGALEAGFANLRETGEQTKKAPKGGGTRIKVEINVTTNREPNRVARLIKDELVRLDRSVQRNVPRYDRRK